MHLYYFCYMQQPQSLYLFVYGSLRSGFSSSAYNYISKYFRLIGLAKTKGLLFDMGEYPVAKPTDNEKYLVGELYKINNPEAFDFVFAQLDDYEGVNENGESLYYRATTEVLLEDKSIKAWVYWFNGKTTNKTVIESGNVFDYLAQKKK